MNRLPIKDANALLNASELNSEFRSRRDECWYWCQADDDGNGRALLLAPMIFRGQYEHHYPMLPAVARDLESNAVDFAMKPPQDQAKLILRQAQMWWFGRELENHPVTTYAKQNGLALNRIGLAQHYGIPTHLLDLTDDFDVAAFFATCRPTPQGWEPVKSGVGVIYCVDFEKNKGFRSPVGNYVPLGPQPLPRPSEQCAWTAELPNVHSFENWPNVRLMLFYQQEKISKHFFNRFKGERELFPHDPLVDVANEIMSCMEIPKDFIEAAITQFAEHPQGMRKDQIPAVRRKLMSLAEQTEYRRILTDIQIKSLLEDFEWRKKMLTDIEANTVLFKTIS